MIQTCPCRMLAESVKIKNHKKANLIIQSNNYKQSISLAILSNTSDAWHRLVHQRTVLKANTAHSKARKHWGFENFKVITRKYI